MKIAVVGQYIGFVKKALPKYGFKISRKPDIVFSVGGDGTCLLSEKMYPGIPKIFMRPIKKKHNVNSILNSLKKKKYKIIKQLKIEAVVKNRKIVALNDINIHYKPPQAIRFQVKINNRKVANEVIGDGVVISTPYGSTAYFNSITRRTFKKGIGIAFNNPVKKMKPKIVNKNSKIEIKILRGGGFVAGDGIKNIIAIKKGNTIKVKKHIKPARFIKLRNKKVKLKV